MYDEPRRDYVSKKIEDDMQQKSSLSDQCRTVVLGSLLGDGSLRLHAPHYKNARFSFRHSIHQKEYFEWKVDLLKEICGESFVWEQGPDGLGGRKLRFQSRALPELTELYRLTHEGNQLRVRRKWLNMLTPLSLAIWWLDDGSIIANGRKGVLCTDPFPYKEQKLLARYLQKVWGIRVSSIGKIHRDRDGKRREYYRLWFRSSEELAKLLRIILPHVKVASMLPKVLLLYKDSQLQQRWISEVARLTGFSELVVIHHLEEKKKKWKHFRE